MVMKVKFYTDPKMNALAQVLAQKNGISVGDALEVIVRSPITTAGQIRSSPKISN
ncbi:hypothetical protein [Mesorhizobium helmanticense]|uniref:hypothetical protein n=1 Tax=Mesorhizobium helmanticense TaxID=1776423 RepID=UPI00142D814E|nr:hypothetical protein [Mesorhizobium helmanticense]